MLTPKEQEQHDRRIDVIRWYAKNEPKDRKELARFAKAIHGKEWLSHRLCRDHQSPFDFVEAVFFTKAAEVLGVGNRSGFKTMSVALCNVMEMLSRPGIQIGHASAEKGQAIRAQAWTQSFFTSAAMKDSGLTDGAEFLKWTGKLKNESSIEITAATIGGMNALHPNRLRIDEFELVKENIIKEGRMVPQSFNGYERGITFTSSRKHRGGNVDRLLYSRKNSAIAKYVWCLAEVIEECRPERRGERKTTIHVEDLSNPSSPPILASVYDKCGRCPLVADCRGQYAHGGGWIPIDDAIKEFTTLNEDIVTWNAQKRSRRVAAESGKVFVTFRARNIVDHQPIKGVPMFIIVDFGGGGEGKLAVLIGQETAGEARVYAEYVADTIEAHADVAAVESLTDELFPGYSFDEKKSIGDSASPDKIRQWNKYAKRFQLQPVKKLHTRDDMFARLRPLVQPKVGPPLYFVHSRCTTHIDQMASLRSIHQDKKVDTVDAALYLALQVEGKPKAVPGVAVIQPGRHGVVKSEEPSSKEDKLRESLEEFSLGAKFNRLLQRKRRQR